MRRIRGFNGEPTNALELGSVYEEVKAHCTKLIGDPDLALGSDASHVTGSLDGRPWEEPEAMYAVQRLLQRELSYDMVTIRGAFVSFLRGALKTWTRFTSEFNSDGK